MNFDNHMEVCMSKSENPGRMFEDILSCQNCDYGGRMPRNAPEQFKRKPCEKMKISKEYVSNLESPLCLTFMFHIGFKHA